MNTALEVTTPSDREIRITRVFDAPRQLVFEAFTRPEFLRRWLGVFGGITMEVCNVDLRPGGSYRYLWRMPDGSEMGMGGTFREIVPPERIVSTEKFDQSWYPGEAVDTVTFTERAGKTTVVMSVEYESREARDAVLRTPMAEGIGAGYQQLDAVLAEKKRGG